MYDIIVIKELILKFGILINFLPDFCNKIAMVNSFSQDTVFKNKLNDLFVSPGSLVSHVNIVFFKKMITDNNFSGKIYHMF